MNNVMISRMKNLYGFVLFSDPVTRNQIYHVFSLTPLVTNTCFELLL